MNNKLKTFTIDQILDTEYFTVTVDKYTPTQHSVCSGTLAQCQYFVDCFSHA